MIIPFLSVPLFIRLGLYRSVLQYVGMKVILTCFKAITISCFAITFFMYFFQENDLPRSIIPIFWFVSNTFIITSRFLLKGMIYSWDTSVNKRKKTIIYGAGNAGVQLVESLKKSVDYAPIAFIDDDQTIEDFDNAIRIDPKKDYLFYSRGFSKAQTGDYIGAIKDFSSTL